ncbi:MAG: hypothetical protein JNL25_03980 [Rhodospirillaceae bacterium]|nr:hypothetical protein [Rhodospirillaceae bacterium]
MTRIRLHWLAIPLIGCLLLLDHLPAETPQLVLAALSDAPVAADASDWNDLPIMYD